MVLRTMNIFEYDELESPVFTHVTTVVHPVLISFRETHTFFFHRDFCSSTKLLTESALINFYHIYFFRTNFFTPKIISTQFSGRISNDKFLSYLFLFTQILYIKNYVTNFVCEKLC